MSASFHQFLAAAAILARAEVRIDNPDGDTVTIYKVGDYPRDWVFGILRENDDHDAVSVVEHLEEDGWTPADAEELHHTFSEGAAR